MELIIGNYENLDIRFLNQIQIKKNYLISLHWLSINYFSFFVMDIEPMQFSSIKKL